MNQEKITYRRDHHTHTHTDTCTNTHIRNAVNTCTDKRRKRQQEWWENTKRASEIAKWSRWEEREEIRLIEQKVVKCM